MSVVGLDFGTSNAVIAAAGRGGVDVILNGNSQRLNPCMVGFQDSRSMGEGAASTATSNFRNTITSIKRLIGLSFDDPRAVAERKRVPFTCVPIKHASGVESIGVKVKYDSEDTVLPIEAVAGMMVKHMGGIVAEKSASSSNIDASHISSLSDASNPLFPQDWVISVPGYYTDAQKRAFLAGCQIVGVTGVQRLMHENTATALAYGIFKDIRKEFTKDKPTLVMFIDMGAAAYSVSIVAFEPGKLIVKSSHYDPDLGGRDFDYVIAQWISDQFEAKYKGKLSGKPLEKPKVLLKLLAAAEKAKKTLSPAGVRETHINLECLMDDFDFGITLKAEQFEQLSEPYLDRLAPPIQRALNETKLQPSDLASVEIVGGGTRVGCLKRRLAKILHLDESATNNGLSTTMNADESVARGTALQSAILSPRFKVLPYEIVEHQPFPIKVAWDGDNNEQGLEVEGEVEASNSIPTNSVIMFDRGSNFPCVRRVTLRRSGEFIVTVSYDESALDHAFPKNVTRDIVTFKIKAPSSSEEKVRVNVKQDIHGTILLSSAQMVEEILEDEEMTNGDDAKESDDKKEGTEAKVEKKKKIRKTNLEFSESRPLEFSKAEIEKAFELEVSMSNRDRVKRETADMRNELESYIYDMRDKIDSDSHLGPYCTDHEKKAFSSALETNENWLYEDGFDATKSVYSDKLKDLKKLGDPIMMRQYEAASRPNAVQSLQNAIERYREWVNSSTSDEKYSHITDEERTKCHAKCDEISAWMYDMMDKQGSLGLNVDPVFKVSDIRSKNTELTSTINPIMNKPRPKPKPIEKKPEETKETSPTADMPVEDTNGTTTQEPMEMDDKPTENVPEPMDTQ